MLRAPFSPGRSHSTLHFIKNKEHLILVAKTAESLEPFPAKMVVAAFTLNRFDDDGGNIDAAFSNELHDLLLRFLFSLDYFIESICFGKCEVDAGGGNTRPIEFGEEVRLPRIGIGQTHGV